MAQRFSIHTGGLVVNGTQQPILKADIQFPDTFANLTFSGYICPAQTTGGLAAAVALSGSPIALPGVPGGGLSLNWILEVNATTGVVQIKAGTAATTGTQLTPTADAGNLVILTHTITNGDTVPWLRAPTFNDLNF